MPKLRLCHPATLLQIAALSVLSGCALSPTIFKRKSDGLASPTPITQAPIAQAPGAQDRETSINGVKPETPSVARPETPSVTKAETVKEEVASTPKPKDSDPKSGEKAKDESAVSIHFSSTEAEIENVRPLGPVIAKPIASVQPPTLEEKTPTLFKLPTIQLVAAHREILTSSAKDLRLPKTIHLSDLASNEEFKDPARNSFDSPEFDSTTAVDSDRDLDEDTGGLFATESAIKTAIAEETELQAVPDQSEIQLASLDPESLSEIGESQTSGVKPVAFKVLKKLKPKRFPKMNLGLGHVTGSTNAYRSRYLTNFIDRVGLYDDMDIVTHCQTEAIETPGVSNSMNALTAWWEPEVASQNREDSAAFTVNMESLVIRTLANSKYLKGLSDLPLIRQRSTIEAMSQFDVTSFMDSKFNRLSDPVGNDLTVGPGGGDRLRENDFISTAGLRRKTRSGTRLDMSQQVGLFNNNSTFINPRHQGNSRLTLNITQPLMSGRGKTYNTSVVMLAKMDERIAWDEVTEQLQDYIVEVVETYWQLYLQRAKYEQNKRHLERAKNILAELGHRRSIDAVDSQIARVRSAVRTRQAEVLRSRTDVRNTESRLRGLVNDPDLYGSAVEIIPAEVPHCIPMNVSLQDSMAQALQSRSEIDKALQKVRASSVRLNVAKNELMPVLDLVLGTYVAGLRGDNDIGRSLADQFRRGEPGYNAGLVYELPWGNRRAKNQHARRRIEMRQAISQFESEVEQLMSDVEIAVREVETAYQQIQIRHEAMTAASLDLGYFQRRWELVPGEDRSAVFLLEDILEAQKRLTIAEANYAQTQTDYAVSIIKLKREMGILLSSENIETTRVNCGLGAYQFHKHGPAEIGTEFGMGAIPMDGDMQQEIILDSPVHPTMPTTVPTTVTTTVPTTMPNQTRGMSPTLPLPSGEQPIELGDPMTEAAPLDVQPIPLDAEVRFNDIQSL